MHEILQTCVSSVPQRNGSVFPLNDLTEVRVKDEYNITYIYWFNESECI